MKGERLKVIGVLLLGSISTFAWDYSSTQNEDRHAAQLRVEASYGKKWKNGLGLKIEEDLRFDMVSRVTTETSTATTTALVGPRFSKSYTTLSLSYKHPRFPYLKGDVGYTLKLINKDTLDVREFMRHRVFFGLTGSYRYENWSFSLRERVQTEIRMDDLDQHTATGYYEDNRANWYLRSRIKVTYHAVSKPVKPYLWVELVNTLNVSEYQQKNGHQFICNVRTQAGVKWRVSRLSSLDFFYRFTYGYDRDINITKKKGYIQLTEETLYMHTVGVRYNLDW